MEQGIGRNRPATGRSLVLARWSIRRKLLLGVAILFAIVAILAFSSFRGVYAYRHLARSISYRRATELRLASELSWNIGELRSIVSRVRRHFEFPAGLSRSTLGNLELREEFRHQFLSVREALKGYRVQLQTFAAEQADDPDSGNRAPEWQTVGEIEQALDAIGHLNEDTDWFLNEVQVEDLDTALAGLHTTALKLPFHLQERMRQFLGEVRGQYHVWIVVTWATCLLAAAMMAGLLLFAYRAVLRPLRCLIHGSRRVARDGDFNHRIRLDTHDEVAELAGAMNAMTDRFQKIRDDLDRQIRERDREVQERTQQIVRSEQLASVGFLAAGVAHEINNPLAAIAWCAESLESRLHDIIQQDDAKTDDEHNAEISVLRNYLRKIQDEAFRCKGITERLLDFSRLGDVEKHPTDLVELVQGVIDMIRHLGKYRQKQIQFAAQGPVIAPVNVQELKQVVLNLTTNALDSLDPGGTVTIELGVQHGQARLVVADNGCGMTEEVQRHLFEPFFTRRRDGQGTGLGLSITYRIIQDHGGEIRPFSAGPGCGSTFRVTLPLVAPDEQAEENRQAA
jgi:signal transduction histidine kinase